MRSAPLSCRKWLLAILLALAPNLAAQPIAISHDGLECWPSDRYPILSGELSPAENLRTVRIYFRSEAYPDYYFVDGSVHADGRLEALLPLAAPGTERVIYYIEAVSRSFETARTREWVPQVSESEDCRRRDPALALFDGGVPEIIVGAVRAGAPAFPPGFLAAGIAGAGSGGVGTAVIVGVAVGGAAGGVVVATGGSGETSSATTSVLAGPPPTSIPSGSSTSGPSTTTTGPPSPTTTAGSSSTTTASPTTSIPGPSTTTTAGTTTVPASTTTTSAPVTTTTSAAPAADMSVSISAPGSATVGTVILYQVVVQNLGPSAASGVQATISFPLSVTFQSATPGSCTGLLGSVQCNLGSMASGGSANIEVRVLALTLGTATATATVTANEPDPATGNNTRSATTNVTLLLREAPEGLVRLFVHLDVPPNDGGDGGEVVVDSRLAGLDDATPVEIAVSPEPGEYTVEALLTRSTGRRGRWRFELRPSPGIELAGIQVEAGEAISSEPRTLTFQTHGQVGERLRFRYRVAVRERR
jgi:uncharacterized repeat protein (TIGR01451 family)